MKKRFLILAAIVVGLGLTACSVETSEMDGAAEKMEKDVKEGSDKQEFEAAVPGATYQCPDDCENGPSFDVPGDCAKCGEKLVIL